MANDFDKFAGSRIKHFRLLRGLSQTALAKEMGMSPQHVYKYECGINRISIQNAYRLKLILGMEWDDFLQSGIRRLSLDDLAEEIQGTKSLNLVKNFLQLSVKKQSIVSQLVKDLLE